MELLLARHGETDYNLQGRLQGQLPIPLNETGILQVQEQATHLGRISVDAIFSSDLERCLTGARQHAACYRNIPLIIEPRWRERSFGVHEGKSLLEIGYARTDYQTMVQHFYDCPCPQGEAFHDFMKRLDGALQRAYESYPQGRVVVHTHGGVIMATLNRLLGEELTSCHARPHKNGYVSFLSVLKERESLLVKESHINILCSALVTLLGSRG